MTGEGQPCMRPSFRTSMLHYSAESSHICIVNGTGDLRQELEREKDEGRRYSIFLGKRHAFCFYVMSWRRFECVLGHRMIFSAQSMNSWALYPSQVNLAPVHRVRRE